MTDAAGPVDSGRRVWLAAGLLAAVVLAFTLATAPRYGITSDEPVIYYGGEWQVWAMGSQHPDRWRFKQPPPPEFAARTHWTTHPDGVGHHSFPGFPGFFCAMVAPLASRLFGWGPVDSMHAGIALLHALAVLALVLYLARLLGLRRALLVAGLYALFPTAVAHSHYNVKDWPMTGFYALTLVSFAVSVAEDRARFLLQSSFWLGLGLASKANLVFTGPTLLLWLPFAALLFWRDRLPSRRWVLALGAMPWVALLTLWAAWPYLRAGNIGEQLSKFSDMVSLIAARGVTERATVSDYPFLLLAVMTPPVELVGLALAAWMPLAWLKRGAAPALRREMAVTALGWVWLAVPMIRIAWPRSNYYDANRHFLEYVPAVALLAGIGLDFGAQKLGSWLGPKLKRGGRWVGAGAMGVVLLLAAWPVVQYHPYESTYYNLLVGGLGGAQRLELTRSRCEKMEWWCIDSEGDYWGYSLRDAVRDVTSNAAPNQTLYPCGNLLGPLMKWQDVRPDMRVVGKESADWLILIPRRPFCSDQEQRWIRDNGELVREVRRGGGPIYGVYRRKR